ncbi:MAG: DoxX family protein [Polyangiaceae bacterium]
MNAIFKLLSARDESSRSLVLVRLATGAVFLSSGIVKVLFENQGVGRFGKLGFSPAVATFVSTVEIVAGLLVILGLATRVAALSLAVDMVVAIVTTKLPILLGAPPEPINALPKLGFWAFAYQARLDVTMLVLCVAVVLAGAGAYSIDAILSRRRTSHAMDRDGLPAT